ncbi:unnamed protein product [Lathyrus oleraceus]
MMQKRFEWKKNDEKYHIRALSFLDSGDFSGGSPTIHGVYAEAFIENFEGKESDGNLDRNGMNLLEGSLILCK